MENMAVRKSERLKIPQVDHEDIMREKLVTLSRSCRGHAADVTRKYSDFTCKLESGDPRACASSYESLCKAFSKYQQKYHEYCNLAPAGSVESTAFQSLEVLMNSAEMEMQRMAPQSAAEIDVRDELRPEDSVSHQGSGNSGSSVSSALAQASAKKAALQTKLNFMKQEQDLELEQLRLRSEMKTLKLRKEFEAASAEEETLAKFVSGSGVNNMKGVSFSENSPMPVETKSVNLSENILVSNEPKYVNIRENYQPVMFGGDVPHYTAKQSATLKQSPLVGFGDLFNADHEPSQGFSYKSSLNPNAREWINEKQCDTNGLQPSAECNMNSNDSDFFNGSATVGRCCEFT